MCGDSEAKGNMELSETSRKFSKDRSVGTGKVCGWGGGRGKLVEGLVDIELYPKDNEVQLEELESGGSRT